MLGFYYHIETTILITSAAFIRKIKTETTIQNLKQSQKPQFKTLINIFPSAWDKY